MQRITIQPTSGLRGSPIIPGDKSISHRSLIFGAIAEGKTQIKGLLGSADVQSTQYCLKTLGVNFEKQGDDLIVEGKGLHGLQTPTNSLDCGNSGTTIRLLMGLLSGQKFSSILLGDSSLSKRPMKRVAAPLIKMGAQINLSENQYCPLEIKGTHLQAIDYELPVASAQIKSAILLASLYTKQKCTLTGKINSRDHSERLLKHFGVKIDCSASQIETQPQQKLTAKDVNVPSDLSSAAFWIAAACITENSKITLNNLSLNPTRTGFLSVLERMGAHITTSVTTDSPEPIGTLEVETSCLKGTKIQGQEIPLLIDEIPLIAILACFAQGKTEVRDAKELRVKESDRIEVVAKNLRAMGAQITTYEDGFMIDGPQNLNGANINPHHDHRIAMAFTIAALRAKGETHILDADCVNISYPEFFNTLESLKNG